MNANTADAKASHANASRVPVDHAHRHSLNNEVHARPPVPMRPPMRASYLVCHTGTVGAGANRRAINELAGHFGVAPPGADDSHYVADMGPFRVKWERHTEFIGYIFIADGAPDDSFSDPAIKLAPADWLAELPGEVLLATHVALVADGGDTPDHERISRGMFAGNVLVGADIAAGAGVAMTDFHIHGDGFSRLLVVNRTMSPSQAGRNIQRLLEMDSYRMMALLAFPTARALSPLLTEREQELVEITAALAGVTEADELSLLNRLTRLQADIESRYSSNNYRFDAANAYYTLVQQRIADLREQRIPGMPTFREFTERRLAPAMDTCRAVSVRQKSLTQGVARATQLLSTRVDMERREQNQAVLESMDRRAGQQLRLQEAVETLSIVAVTYYMVGLVGFASDGINQIQPLLNTGLVKAVSIPIVASLVFVVVRRVRKRMTKLIEGL